MKYLFLHTFSFFLLFYSALSCQEHEAVTIHSNEPSLYSRNRNLDQAFKMAQYSINLVEDVPTKNGRSREIESVDVIVSELTKSDINDQDTLMFVFNFANNEGFSIIAADKSHKPIIAVTEMGHYDTTTGTEIDAVNQYIEGVKQSLRTPGPGDPIILFTYDEYYIHADSCVNIMTTKWGQRDIYGQYCPNGISGCVATALGQILAFKQIPTSFETTVQMGEDYAIGDTVQLNWSLINQHIQTHSDYQVCTPVHKQIGALLREIGDLVNMNYGLSSSGSDIFYASDFLTSWGIGHSPISSANTDAIMQSLSNGCPVYIRGYDNSHGGHAWVADGFKFYERGWITYELVGPAYNHHYEPVSSGILEASKLLHFNWGWNGVCNGYFSFDCYSTADGEIYDGNANYADYNFSEDVLTICNIGLNH